MSTKDLGSYGIILCKCTDPYTNIVTNLLEPEIKYTSVGFYYNQNPKKNKLEGYTCIMFNTFDTNLVNFNISSLVDIKLSKYTTQITYYSLDSYQDIYNSFIKEIENIDRNVNYDMTIRDIINRTHKVQSGYEKVNRTITKLFSVTNLNKKGTIQIPVFAKKGKLFKSDIIVQDTKSSFPVDFIKSIGSLITEDDELVRSIENIKSNRSHLLEKFMKIQEKMCQILRIAGDVGQINISRLNHYIDKINEIRVKYSNYYRLDNISPNHKQWNDSNIFSKEGRKKAFSSTKTEKARKLCKIFNNLSKSLSVRKGNSVNYTHVLDLCNSILEDYDLRIQEPLEKNISENVVFYTTFPRQTTYQDSSNIIMFPLYNPPINKISREETISLLLHISALRTEGEHENLRRVENLLVKKLSQ